MKAPSECAPRGKYAGDVLELVLDPGRERHPIGSKNRQENRTGLFLNSETAFENNPVRFSCRPFIFKKVFYFIIFRKNSQSSSLHFCPIGS